MDIKVPENVQLVAKRVHMQQEFVSNSERNREDVGHITTKSEVRNNNVQI